MENTAQNPFGQGFRFTDNIVVKWKDLVILIAVAMKN